MWFVMKTRQDNDMIDHASVFYVKNDIELLWLIEPGIVCDKN